MARDLRGTEAARIFEHYFDQIAQGNEGDATVERMEIEGAELRFKVAIRHRHRVRILTRRITVYDLTTHAEGKVDIRSPDPRDLQVCSDSPVGRVCANMVELVPVLGGLGL